MMRPRGVTAVASVNTSAAAADRELRRGARGASRRRSRRPQEYWHIGETTMRLRSVTPRSERGAKRDMPNGSGCGAGSTQCEGRASGNVSGRRGAA